MKKKLQLYALAFVMAAGSTAFAVEDGLGTNHVQTLKVYNGIIMSGTTITNWQSIASSTLTNNSITTAMLQDGAVTAAKVAAAVAGDGLTGGAGTALAVGAGSGISVAADAVAVDATVVRTTGDQSMDGVKTFTSSPVVPTPTTAMQASTKKYVDDKLSSSVASGTVASDTLRWTGSVWTNTAGLTVDGSGNAAVGGTLGVTGITTLSATTTSTDKDTGALVVQGGAGIEENLNVGGTAKVTGITTLSATTTSTTKDTGALVVEGGVGIEENLNVGGNIAATGNATVNGNTTLGNAGTDTITFTAKAASSLNMDSAYTVTGLTAPSADSDAATKLYVDSAVNGLSWKQAVVAASAAAATLSTDFENNDTIDGVVLATGNRVLVKNQASSIENGIYEVKATGAPSRVKDLDAAAETAGAAVFVSGGTANAGTAWVCTTPNATVGAQAITFAQFASPGTYTAGDGLNLSGLQFSVDATDFAGSGLEVNGADLRIAASAAGGGLTGGAGVALAVGQGDGISVAADSVAVDSTVIRTTTDQSIAGVKTFTDSPVVPTPTTAMQASTKKYVDDKLSSSVASGTVASDTLRWTGSVWTNTAGLTVDGSGNAAVGGTLGVTGIATLSATTTSTDKDTGALVVQGGVGIEENLNVGGTAKVTGAVTISSTTASTTKDTGSLVVEGGIGAEGAINAGGALTVAGNTTLGDAGTDTITFTAKAASSLNMDSAYTVTGLTAPSADSDAATKLYVDSAINGLSWKQPVAAASTAAATLSTDFENNDTIDGVVLATGNRVLVKNQASSIENGIYEVKASGAPSRVKDLDAAAETTGAAVFVSGGTANAGTAWVCTTPNATVGTAPITFAQFASPGTYSAGDGMTLTGLSFAAKPSDFTGAGLEVNSGDIRIAAGAAGDGLTGGGGSALAVNSTVIRTTTDQSIAGVKTFTDSPVVPTPTTAMQASTKKYVDDKLSSSVASGTVASDTLRWTGTVWTNTAGLTVDGSGNAAVGGTLGVTGIATLSATTTSTDKDTGALVVQGGVGIEENLNVGGTAKVTGAVTISSTTTSTDKDTGALIIQGGAGIEENLNVGGNTALGNAIGTDTLTVNAKATFAGAVVLTQSSLLDIPVTGITSAQIQQPYLQVRGNGGAIDITTNPQISTTGAVAGQMLTIQGMSDSNTLKLDDGNGLSLNGGVSFTLKAGGLIQFIYDGSVWREMLRTVPTP